MYVIFFLISTSVMFFRMLLFWLLAGPDKIIKNDSRLVNYTSHIRDQSGISKNQQLDGFNFKFIKAFWEIMKGT